MKKHKTYFTFIDLFAGIGGFRIAIEVLGGKCVGFSEIDKKAIQTYKENFDTSNEKELGDIVGLTSLPKHNLLVGGVPCQPWSVAGAKKGFNDPRGQLWNDVIRLVDLNQPKSFIFENVKGLYDPKNRQYLEIIEENLRNCSNGYWVTHKLINSFDFGLPQNRDRVFIVGIRKDLLQSVRQFDFPKPIEGDHKLYHVIDGVTVFSEHLTKTKHLQRDLFGERTPMSRNPFQKIDELNDFFILCDTRNGHTTIHSWDIKRTTKREREICLTILKNRRKSKYGEWDGNPLSFHNLSELIPKLDLSELDSLVKRGFLRREEDDRYELVNTKNSAGINGIYRVFLPNSDIFSTITATGTNDMVALKTISGATPLEYKRNFIKEILKKKQYRPISSKEAARLQGFPDDFVLHEDEKVAKKQFGNAVPVPVVYHIVQSLINARVFNNNKKGGKVNVTVTGNSR